MDKPRIKPLVWRDALPSTNPSYSPNTAPTPFGMYYANTHAFWFEGSDATKYPSREAAKAAAQADYEARILAALEPVTVQEAARVLYEMPKEDRMKVWRATRGCPTSAEFGKWFCKGLRALIQKDAE